MGGTVRRLYNAFQAEQLATRLLAQRVLVGQVTTANEDGSYDVRIADERNTIVPGLWRHVVEQTRLAPGDAVGVRMTGAAIELL